MKKTTHTKATSSTTGAKAPQPQKTTGVKNSPNKTKASSSITSSSNKKTTKPAETNHKAEAEKLAEKVDKSCFVSKENPQTVDPDKGEIITNNTFTCKQTLKAHNDWVLHILPLKNNRFITCSEDKTLRLWDLTESPNKPIQIYKGHEEGVITCIQFTNSKLISCSRDKTLRIWNIESGKELACIKSIQPYYCIEQISDAQIAVAGGDSDIRVYDLSNEDETDESYKLEGHQLVIRDLAYIDESTMASCSEDKTIKVWNFMKRELLFTLEGHTEGVKCILLLQDKRLASGAYDNTIKIWDLKTLRCDITLEGHTGHVISLIQLGNGKLVSGATDWSILVWDIKTGKIEKEVEGHSESVNTLALLPNGRVLSGSSDNTVKIWE